MYLVANEQRTLLDQSAEARRHTVSISGCSHSPLSSHGLDAASSTFDNYKWK